MVSRHYVSLSLWILVSILLYYTSADELIGLVVVLVWGIIDYYLFWSRCDKQ